MAKWAILNPRTSLKIMNVKYLTFELRECVSSKWYKDIGKNYGFDGQQWFRSPTF